MIENGSSKTDDQKPPGESSSKTAVGMIIEDRRGIHHRKPPGESSSKTAGGIIIEDRRWNHHRRPPLG
jgi:hypothetical protein